MDAVILHLIEGLVTSSLGAVGGVVVATHRRNRAMEHGMTAILRQQLIELHRIWVIERGYAPVEIKEQADDIYEAYSGLGGNGTGTELHRQILEAHAVPPKEVTA